MESFRSGVVRIAFAVCCAFFACVFFRADASTHLRATTYYFEDSSTGELRTVVVAPEERGSALAEYVRADPYRRVTVPRRDFFEGWDLVGFRDSFWQNDYGCRWDDGVTKIDESGRSVSREVLDNNPCRSLPDAAEMTPDDLGPRDSIRLAASFASYFAAVYALGLAFDFFCFFGLFYPLARSGIRSVSLRIALIAAFCVAWEALGAWIGMARIPPEGAMISYWPFAGVLGYSYAMSPFYVWGLLVFFRRFRFFGFRAPRLRQANALVAALIVALSFALLRFQDFESYDPVENALVLGIVALGVFALFVFGSPKEPPSSIGKNILT